MRGRPVETGTVAVEVAALMVLRFAMAEEGRTEEVEFGKTRVGVSEERSCEARILKESG